MDKTTLGLIAAVGAFAVSPALAAASADVTDQILKPRTVAELLEPIAKPVETLAALDASRQLEGVELAQADIQINPFGFGYGNGDGYGYGYQHHHHHQYYRRHYHHHHHHHYRHHHYYNNNYNNY